MIIIFILLQHWTPPRPLPSPRYYHTNYKWMPFWNNKPKIYTKINNSLNGNQWSGDKIINENNNIWICKSINVVNEFVSKWWCKRIGITLMRRNKSQSLNALTVHGVSRHQLRHWVFDPALLLQCRRWARIYIIWQCQHLKFLEHKGDFKVIHWEYSLDSDPQ